MLKALNNTGFRALCNVFNICLASGSYPWSSSIISPIHKSGDRYDPDNYRAIAVSSCIGKLFSSILLNRLVAFRHQHCPDPINQLGFCKDAQTNDHIFTLKTIIDKYRKKKRQKLFACFVDLKKAFDTVSRPFLLHKITNLGIEGKFFTLLKNMYDNSHAKIKLEKLLSPSFKIEKGTEQGHPISPELFKMYILDLSSRLEIVGDFPCLLETIVNHLLWADDLVLLALNEISLQNILNILNDFCTDWELEINLKKTKILAFGSRKCDTKFVIGDNQIEYADRYCYLGIVFDKNGTFTPALSELRKKSLKAFFGLKRYILRDALSFDALLKLFDSLIKPVLLYGCQIIAPHTLLTKILANTPNTHNYFNTVGNNMYEKFQLKFLKWACGVHRKTSNLAIFGDTGRYPITINAIKLAIDYFDRCNNAPEHTLLYKSFAEQRILNLEWHANITDIINKYNLNSTRIRSTSISQNLYEEFRNLWKTGIDDSEKLVFYKTIKSNFERELYLKIRNFEERSNICKLRASAHSLAIEQGRYTTPKTPRCERVCIFCLFKKNNITVETEMHALTECPLYDIPKSIFAKNINRPIVDVLKDPQNVAEQQKLGALCTSIFDIHDAFLEYTKINADKEPPDDHSPCIIL